MGKLGQDRSKIVPTKPQDPSRWCKMFVFSCFAFVLFLLCLCLAPDLFLLCLCVVFVSSLLLPSIAHTSPTPMLASVFLPARVPAWLCPYSFLRLSQPFPSLCFIFPFPFPFEWGGYPKLYIDILIIGLLTIRSSYLYSSVGHDQR